MKLQEIPERAKKMHTSEDPGIYLHLPYFAITNQQNVGKYTSPMDVMGMVSNFWNLRFHGSFHPLLSFSERKFFFRWLRPGFRNREFEEVRTTQPIAEH